jgi:hypothetical protein
LFHSFDAIAASHCVASSIETKDRAVWMMKFARDRIIIKALQVLTYHIFQVIQLDKDNSQAFAATL